MGRREARLTVICRRAHPSYKTNTSSTLFICPKFLVPLAVHDGFVTFSLDRNDRRVVVARIALSWRREGRSGTLGVCHRIRCGCPT